MIAFIEALKDDTCTPKPAKLNAWVYTYVFLLYKTCIGCYNALRNAAPGAPPGHEDSGLHWRTSKGSFRISESQHITEIHAVSVSLFVKWGSHGNFVFSKTHDLLLLGLCGFSQIGTFLAWSERFQLTSKITSPGFTGFPGYKRWYVPGAGLLQSCKVAFSYSRNLGCHGFILEMVPGEFLERLEWSWMIDDASWWFWHNLIYTAIACHSLVNQRSADHSHQGTKSGPLLDCPLLRSSSVDENGQSKPDMHRTHSKAPLFAMLMDPASQPQSEMETDPKSRVLVPGGHILQRLPPSTSWYAPTGQRLHERLAVSFWYAPTGQGLHKVAAPEAWKLPLPHGRQMKVMPHAVHAVAVVMQVLTCRQRHIEFG